MSLLEKWIWFVTVFVNIDDIINEMLVGMMSLLSNLEIVLSLYNLWIVRSLGWFLIPTHNAFALCIKKKKKKKAAQNWLLQCFLLMLNMLLPLERSTLWKFHKLNPGEVKESAQIVWRLTYQVDLPTWLIK